MTVFRSLRTLWATGWVRAMRTRELRAPIRSVASTPTRAIGPPAAEDGELERLWLSTPRKSSTTVSGSGRLVTYGAGSVTSMTSDAPFACIRDVMDFSCTAGAAGDSADPVRPAAYATSDNITERAKPRVRVTTWHPPGIAAVW